MGSLQTQISQGLSEARILTLGSQVVLGLQFNAVFQPTFDRLETPARLVHLFAIATVLMTIALLFSTGLFHQVSEHGNDTGRMHQHLTQVLRAAMVPFALALGLDLGIASGHVLRSQTAALLIGALVGVAALSAWLLIAEVIARRQRSRQGGPMKEEPTPLKQKIDQVLTELRVLIPGAQALLGFQFTTILTDAFAGLPVWAQRVHLLSLLLMTGATIILMAPASFHRIVEHGEDTSRFYRFASRMLIVAAFPIAFAISLDVAVVVEKVVHRGLLDIIVAALTLLTFLGLWFGYSLYRSPHTPRLRAA